MTTQTLMLQLRVDYPVHTIHSNCTLTQSISVDAINTFISNVEPVKYRQLESIQC